MKKNCKINLLIWLVLFISIATPENVSHCGEAREDSSKTNLKIIQNMFGNITGQVLSAIPGNENILGFKIHKTEGSWIVEHAIINEVFSRGYKIKLINNDENNIPYIFVVGDAGAKVNYSNVFRKGLFGKKYVNRSVKVSMQAQVIESETGNVLLSRHFTDEFHDTVVVDNVNLLEDENIPMTRAKLPDESLIDRFIEPIVIIGATGVAVFLFFHIRS